MVTSEGGGGDVFIYGKEGNRSSGMARDFQLFRDSSFSLYGWTGKLAVPFFKNGLPFQPAPRLLWSHGSIDRSGEGCINNHWPAAAIGAIRFSEVEKKRRDPSRCRAKKACVRGYRFCIYPSRQGAVKRDSDTCDCQIRRIGRLLSLFFLPPWKI